MIRSGADIELHTTLGIVCLHAHIYCDRIKDSEALQDEVQRLFTRLRKELVEQGFVKPYPHEKVAAALPEEPK